MPGPIPRWKPPHLRGVKLAKETAHYRTSDWKSRRLRILVRDAYTCRACGLVCHSKDAHVDHVIPLEEFGTDDDSNLQTLCSSCHGRKTRDEQKRGGFA